MSLLTITSHHYAYRSHNSVSFHHSQAIERNTPTTARNHVHNEHGTRVTVRNLFGNMPVRVKQRSMATDQKVEQQRLRDSLKKETVGLVLSWQGSASIRVRDGDNKPIVNLNTSNTTPSDPRSASTQQPQSAHLSLLLQVMTQANYIAVDEWASWVPVSASTATLSVKGAISLEPSPTKQVQFLSFGLQPLSNDNGHNELYDQINRLFALSSFGNVENDADVGEQERLRRQSDKRFKTDGYTNRQLKARKGVDRYPMFHLRISLEDKSASDLMKDQFIEDESNLQAVVDIFTAMITQWLSVHHFRPRKLLQPPDRPKLSSLHSRVSDEQDPMLSRKRRASVATPVRSTTDTSSSGLAVNNTIKRQRLAMAPLENLIEKPRQQAFAEWSRIKSGKSSFFDSTTSMHKAGANISFRTPPDSALGDTDRQQLYDKSQQEHATFSVAPISKGALSNSVETSFSKSENVQPETSTLLVTDEIDEIVSWTDPSTGKTHFLNARTGCVVSAPRLARPQTDSAISASTNPPTKTNDSLRLTTKPATAEPAKTPWLDDLLQTWDNPIYKPSEQGVQQMSLQDDLELGGNQRLHNRPHCSHFDIQRAFNEAGSDSARLSKDALRSAEVISQVDKKFILVRMASASTNYKTHRTADIMVLIDQHAADERIQVEILLNDLCNPVQNETHSRYQSKLGYSSLINFVHLEKPLQFAVSPREHAHFNTFAAHFAAWGILYDMSNSVVPNSRPGITEKDTCMLSVTSLPHVISERCKADPQLLISFLRSALWKYVESPPLVPVASNDQRTNWVKKIATCPPGLVDMVNSRACRSAIMFNDKLNLEACNVLVGKLADCVFPFMCAHGRPSMVPIFDLGKVGYASDGFRKDEMHKERNFVDAWKKWKR